jgi:hypothetical protein
MLPKRINGKISSVRKREPFFLIVLPRRRSVEAPILEKAVSRRAKHESD